MKELIVISGKGGTGKTSVTASFAVLAGGAVLCDCDVDASDLPLVLAPEIREDHDFYSGREARIEADLCTSCGVCADLCRFDAVRMGQGGVFTIDPLSCEGCGVCVRFCPAAAVTFTERYCGKWFVSETRCGPLVHARLGIGAENSGKLVSLVRREARRLAGERGIDRVVCDGPPGIGCPVIASLTGATAALVVTEPTVSGVHDLDRVLALTAHFRIPAYVAVNKWDLNPGMTEAVEEEAVKAGAIVLGRIRYDGGVTRAQLARKAVVETDAPCAEDILKLWENLDF
ncbi:MAG TPA: ATP-binding protein [Syntrophales bacterium]|nr:ATP-binding protein [Syntrophales bacterium]HOM06270.1 ATP-binding protein [Syntrophales bacterium]HON99291.1 ATP-binding protein [Syntrophales bacterium]HPC00116.1 ATP-binding protein [Syntrophales bacterium]HPQ05749.1 ATP-binding protein [Syntrophales bacterium]